MKYYFIWLYFIFSLYSFAQDDHYFLMDDYFEKNPLEKQKLVSFEKLVQSAPTLEKTPIKPLNIVMVYPADQISDYWRRSKVSFEKRLQKLNIKYNLQNLFTKPGTVSKQARYIQEKLTSDIDYLIFTLDAKKHSKLIESLIFKTKPKIILQNITTPLQKWENIQPFFYVGFDHRIGSLKIAEYFINKTKGEGKYAVLYGTLGYVSKMRGDQFVKYVRKQSKLQLVESYYTDFDTNKAYEATKDILKKHSDLKFIYTTSTDIAHGVIKALREKKLTNKILVNGWGGGSSELKALKKGYLDVTVMRINDDNGIAMAEAIKLDLHKNQNKIPKVFSGQMVLIDKNTPHKKIYNLTQKAFRYSQ